MQHQLQELVVVAVEYILVDLEELVELVVVDKEVVQEVEDQMEQLILVVVAVEEV
jgi:hypothetical protein